MVKVGIYGAETPLAGEIIRLLNNHPETELVCLYSPEFNGRNISSIHHGFIGETSRFFTDKINLKDLDYLIVLKSDEITEKILNYQPEDNNLKILLYSDKLNKGFEIGISEINRKALVRGADKAAVPSPLIVPILITLIPLANYMLLNSDIEIETQLPSDISEILEETKQMVLIENLLKDKQPSFNGKVKLKIQSDHINDRTHISEINIPSSLPIDEILKIYDDIYDDHNFTFTTLSDISTADVEGTQKVIINISKPDSDTLSLKIISDSRMRGGAGDAVHIMNLFFGLHEKTGLHLKSSRY